MSSKGTPSMEVQSTILNPYNLHCLGSKIHVFGENTPTNLKKRIHMLKRMYTYIYQTKTNM